MRKEYIYTIEMRNDANSSYYNDPEWFYFSKNLQDARKQIRFLRHCSRLSPREYQIVRHERKEVVE